MRFRGTVLISEFETGRFRGTDASTWRGRRSTLSPIACTFVLVTIAVPVAVYWGMPRLAGVRESARVELVDEGH
jgi:hypothetical protein